MRSFRIDRDIRLRALAARSRASVGALATATALTLGWQTTLTSTAGASETTPQAKPPVVSTDVARQSGSGVELTGSINPEGQAATYYFQYGPTTTYGSQTPSASLSAGKTRVKISQVTSGLQPGYHYRLVASNGSGPTDGRDRVYNVAKKAPTKTNPKRVELKFTLAKPPAQGQPVGSSVTIEGTLSGPGAAGHGVVLQSSTYPSGAVFENVGAQQKTSTAGRFSFFIARLSRSTRFRVAAVGLQPTYSPVIIELATVHVTLHVRSAPKAGLVRLYGTVSPAVSGAIVYFQLQKASKPPKITIPKSEKAEEKAEERAETPRFATLFSTPVKRATKTISRFSIVTGIRQGGLYRAYVQVPKGPLASGYSTSVILNATKTKKKSKRKS